MLVVGGDVKFGGFVGLCFEVLVCVGFIWIYFKMFLLRVVVFGNVLGIDVYKFRFGVDFLMFF